MASPRASWTGQLKLGWGISFGIRLFGATSRSEGIELNQLCGISAASENVKTGEGENGASSHVITSSPCHQRLSQEMHCAAHGKVERDTIVKGYEYEPDKYVVLDPAELEASEGGEPLEDKTLEIKQFVEIGDLPRTFFDAAFFVAPDGPLDDDPFRAFRDSLRRGGKVGIGRLKIYGRPRYAMIEPTGRGFTMFTLRSYDQVRTPGAYFESIVEGPANRKTVHEWLAKMAKQCRALDVTDLRDERQERMVALLAEKVEALRAESDEATKPRSDDGEEKKTSPRRGSRAGREKAKT